MPLGKKALRMLLFAGLLVSSVSCDQGTKIWARHSLSDRAEISVIDGFWDFRLAQNPDAAFSLLRDVPGRRYLLTGVGVLIVGLLLVWLRRLVEGPWLPVAALGIIAGAALGNLADRILFGSVTDFVYWHWRERSWPIFNVADALLVVGVTLLLFSGRAATRANR